MGPSVAVALSLLILGVSRCYSDPVISIVSYTAGPLPTITADGFIELQFGSSATFRCVGDSSLLWEMPEIAPVALIPQNRFENRTVETRSVTSSCNSLEPQNGCYSANLTLMSVKATDMGAINCRDDRSVASVFLFVSGSSILCLPVKTFVRLTYNSSSGFVPCIATSRASQSISLSPSIMGTTYDPRRGYFVPKLSSSGNPMTCTCGPATHLIFVAVTEYPTEPFISIYGGRSSFLIGEALELECTSAISLPKTISIKWLTPSGQEPKAPDYSVQNASLIGTGGVSGRGTYLSKLFIRSLAVRDRGVFHCLATTTPFTSSSNFSFAVLETPVVNFVGANGFNVDGYMEGDSPRIEVRVSAVPPPDAFWVFGNDRNRLAPGSKYDITNITSIGDMHTYGLTVMAMTREDIGNYSLFVTAANLTQRRVFTLLVNVPPTVTLDPSGVTYTPPPVFGTAPRQQQQTLHCRANAVPIPKLSWLYQPCVATGCADSGASAWEELANRSSPVDVYRRHNQPQVTTTSVYESQVESQVVIIPLFSGRYRCNATNKLNTTVQDVQVIVRHGSSNLLLAEPTSSRLELAIGETRNFTCLANVWMLGLPNFYRKVPGSNQNVAIRDDDPCCVIVRSRFPPFNTISNNITLVFKGVRNETLSIGCEAEVLSDAATVNSTDMVEVVVSHPMPPRFVLALPAGVVNAKAGTLVQFACLADGFPQPTITWSKDGEPINFKPGGVIALSTDGKNLTIERAHETDKGVYTCVAASIFGRVSSNATLAVVASGVIPRLSDTNVAIIVVIVVLVLVSTVVGTVFIVRRFCRKKAIPHEFLLPTKDMLNPDIPLDEQTDCLPYDAEWEFPRESLKMGMLLGQGAFGRVLKADAFGIEPGVAVTTVAVKTVRDSDDIEQIKALISELKILIHLGQHLNIVNLLGAATRRLKRGELLVIVEYCRYGNLRSYLLKHKAHFIDVLDAEGERSLAARQSSRRSALPSVSGGGDASDDYLNSSSRSQMHCEENPLTTLDLIYWSFQISRGMQYLASIQYIHRDLAARNVLLCDDGIVKICDFGLAKDIYKYHEYKKKTDGPLPIKWMALESLTHKLFTTASDVWSFGVTLWELFSMAATPYPGIELNEAFLEKLQAGYRMEQPKHAPDVIYKIMLKCWHPEAFKRPTFADLSSELAELLSEPVRNHYFALEAPYTEKRDARQDYPPHYHKGLTSDKDNDYLPVISSAGTSSAATSSAVPPAAADLDRAPTDYYNVGRSRPLDQSANKEEKAAAEEGTSDEKVPLSVAASVFEDVNGHDVFEGEDIPMPTSVAPLPSPQEVERYAQMNQLAKDKRGGLGSPSLKLPTVVPSAADSSGSGKPKSEDKQLLLSKQHTNEQAAAAPPSAVHRPAAGARGAVKTGSTVETAI